MTKQDDTLHKAYDNIPRDIPDPFSFFNVIDDLERLIRYRYIKLIRFFTRRS